MLRITGLKLPLNHAEQDLRKAIVKKLAVADADILAFDLFKLSLEGGFSINREKVADELRPSVTKRCFCLGDYFFQIFSCLKTLN